ncbi:hypothetical protein EOPP23_18565 [Endozoicomonas sp. OPT23]|uniref:ProQ/FINO family protein n=1 Tax=Endozoicomonas sp. OPT23 TaxID=2072845 RepID=UPI00129A9BEA|nr:ProQ/FINO family protein [Endozoicomonas sp. OPT23]MRI34982.1 hypothetical protein [Endozoicomonas sp. OPT23]
MSEELTSEVHSETEDQSNDNQGNENRQAVATEDVSQSEALRLIRERWPEAFSVSRPRPLKIGIHNEIKQTEEFPLSTVKKALKLFTGQERYLLSIKEGRSRVGLDGKPSGKVKLQEAVNAEVLLYQRHLSREMKNQRVFVGQMKVATAEEISAATLAKTESSEELKEQSTSTEE